MPYLGPGVIIVMVVMVILFLLYLVIEIVRLLRVSRIDCKLQGFVTLLLNTVSFKKWMSQPMPLRFWT